jgi:NTE family protein
VALEGRAVVLDGGGVTGIAWEIGVLAGLAEAGVALAAADAVIGTSAGAFVGVALAAGYDLEALFAAQSRPSATEVSASVSEELMQAWTDAFVDGGADRERIGAAFGAIGLADPEPVPIATRRAAVEGRLVTTAWPATLSVTAIDAETGALHLLDEGSGASLVDAVSASGAVPGVWPLVRIDGRAWIDGGMVSTNVRSAAGYRRVVALCPIPYARGEIPGADDDVADLQAAGAAAVLVAPDAASIEAIGPNPYDIERRGPVAAAGRAQGLAVAPQVAEAWG